MYSLTVSIRRHSRLLGGLGLAIIILLTYSPALKGGYLWDDDEAVTENVNLRTAQGLLRTWTVPHTSPQGYYWPLTYTTFWIEYQLWQLHPAGYHAVNLLLHLLNAILLWRILKSLKIEPAWFAAALFALHPVQAETVAWIAERKNTLALLLALGSAWFYLAAETGRQKTRHTFSLLLFIAAMLSKSAVVMLPFVFAALHWWRDGRITKRQAVQLAPFVAVGGLIGVFQAHVYASDHAIRTSFPWIERVLTAGRTFWFYLGKLLWPQQLMAIYPRWEIDPGQWQAYLYPVSALALFVALVLLRKRIGRAPAAALAGFTLALAPMLHFLPQAGFTSVTFVNDHSLYMPSVCLVPLLAAAGYGAIKHLTPPKLHNVSLSFAATTLLVLLASLSFRHTRLFESQETLFAHTLKTNPEAWPAQSNLASAYLQQGNLEQARHHYEETLRLSPGRAEAHNGLGIIAVRQGRREEAIRHFRKALEFLPDYEIARNNLAVALIETKRLDEAARLLDETAEINPYNPETHFNRGLLFAARRNGQKAVQAFERAVEIDPSHADAWHNLAAFYTWQQRYAAAAEAYTRVIDLQRDNTAARKGFAQLLYATGHREQAQQLLGEGAKILRTENRTAEADELEQFRRTLNTAENTDARK